MGTKGVCPYGFLWVVLSCVPQRFSVGCPILCAPMVFSWLSFLVCPNGFLGIVRLCMLLRKPEAHTRKDNKEKTVGAHKKGQFRENRRPSGFLWDVLSCVFVRFSLGCSILCAPTVFSGLSALVCPFVLSRLSLLVCPYGFLWVQRRTIPRKPFGHKRKDNQEKTIRAHKIGQPTENRWGKHERTTPFLCAQTVFSGLSAFVCSYGFL
jgi:hypothetical protein